MHLNYTLKYIKIIVVGLGLGSERFEHPSYISVCTCIHAYRLVRACMFICICVCVLYVLKIIIIRYVPHPNCQ